LLGTLLAVGFVAGCGTGGDGYKGPRGEVQGTVTVKGAPIPEGCIVLFQAAEGPAYMASGIVKDDGTYQLQYQGTRKLPAVAYKVQISPPPSQGQTSPQDPSEIDAEAMKKPAEAAPLPFSEKYASFRTSPLKFTVEEGANVADFDLEE